MLLGSAWVGWSVIFFFIAYERAAANIKNDNGQFQPLLHVSSNF